MSAGEKAGGGRLTHLDETGRARMVDVSSKAVTARVARAAGLIRMQPATLATLRAGRNRKGDPLLVAEIAGIQAAKRTAELIPLCHALPLTRVAVRLEVDDAAPGVRATSEVAVTGRTGVEMEALTAVAVALLTMYDMLKATDRAMRIEEIGLLHKSGGSSGDWDAPSPG